jgi:hypothetical protein
MAFVIEMGGKLHSALGRGDNYDEAHYKVGLKLIKEAAIHDWIDKNHKKTTCELYWMPASDED